MCGCLILDARFCRLGFALHSSWAFRQSKLTYINLGDCRQWLAWGNQIAPSGNCREWCPAADEKEFCSANARKSLFFVGVCRWKSDERNRLSAFAEHLPNICRTKRERSRERREQQTDMIRAQDQLERATIVDMIRPDDFEIEIGEENRGTFVRVKHRLTGIERRAAAVGNEVGRTRDRLIADLRRELFKEDEIRIEYGLSTGGEYVRVVHSPSGISRGAMRSEGRQQEELLDEVLEELYESERS